MLENLNPEQIQDLEGARQAIKLLLNLVEEMKQENNALRAEVQRLRDEINRLKGEQGKANIKGNKKASQDHSSEKERRQRKKRRKGSKLDKISIDREENLSLDKQQLPEDAEFKGYETVVIRYSLSAKTWPSVQTTSAFTKRNITRLPNGKPILRRSRSGMRDNSVQACARWSFPTTMQRA